ncbi:hypothetical protein SEA_KEALII_59 [Arthrobacter phage KeAlii]|uniref:Uncharacterized protein n=1 Tax=Arthrobacter phage KeAlii TaxID=2885973 RepID=A0AA94WSZ0_9CAUD|nr:hypothetical protein PQE15_gp59 [Arthrobacter phage KeAlii]UDL14665.1 hypothetical protein SEA_KEALII_59 [Arthrobacter phage KeAlii]
MFTPQIPLADYLTILSAASAEDHPWTREEDAPNLTPEARAEIGEGFVKMTHGLVAFVTAATKHYSYEDVREVLEDTVHTFPAREDGTLPGVEHPFAALLAAIAAAEATPALIDEEGNVNPDAVPGN